MPRSSRVSLTAVAAVGLFALLLSFTPGTLEARAPGRDFPRCVQSCNEISKICKSRCDVDCAILFPGEPALAIDCTQACKSICIMESQDCKNVCQAIKNGTVEEP